MFDWPVGGCSYREYCALCLLTLLWLTPLDYTYWFPLFIAIHIDVDADVKLGAIMRSLFSNPSDIEAGDKADDEDERLVSRYAEGTAQLLQVALQLFA